MVLRFSCLSILDLYFYTVKSWGSYDVMEFLFRLATYLLKLDGTYVHIKGTLSIDYTKFTMIFSQKVITDITTGIILY